MSLLDGADWEKKYGPGMDFCVPAVGAVTPKATPKEEVECCPACGAELAVAPGIGAFCPRPECGVVDGPFVQECAEYLLTAPGAKVPRPLVQPPPVNAADILTKAANLITQRGVERDKPQSERSMSTTVAAFWALHGESILRTGTMTETQGWEFMELLKMARSTGGCYKADDYEDKVAYAALAAEAAAKEEACRT